MRVGASVGNGVEVVRGVSVSAGVDIATGAAGMHDANSRVERINNKGPRISIALYLVYKMAPVKLQCILPKILAVFSVKNMVRILIINALNRHTGCAEEITGLSSP